MAGIWRCVSRLESEIRQGIVLGRLISFLLIFGGDAWTRKRYSAAF